MRTPFILQTVLEKVTFPNGNPLLGLGGLGGALQASYFAKHVPPPGWTLHAAGFSVSTTRRPQRRKREAASWWQHRWSPCQCCGLGSDQLRAPRTISLQSTKIAYCVRIQLMYARRALLVRLNPMKLDCVRNRADKKNLGDRATILRVVSTMLHLHFRKGVCRGEASQSRSQRLNTPLNAEMRTRSAATVDEARTCLSCFDGAASAKTSHSFE
jgi:hypothetical protein